jgi:hypothetical protein
MKNKICGIYLITERATGRGYVGFTTQVFTDRWSKHKKRFPPQLFEYEVLLPLPLGATEKELKKLERFYITELDTMAPNGFNRTRGGNGSGPRSPEARKKLSEAAKAQHASMTPEQKREWSQKLSEAAKDYEASVTPEEKQRRSQKISEATKAARDNMTPEKKREWSQKISEGKKGIPGAPVSEETRQKLSDAGKSHWSSMTEDEKRERSQKISQSKTGKSGPPQSEETKKKRAETIRGQTRSEEAKKNMSEARKAIAARKRAAKAALEETHTSIEDDQQ